MKYYNKIYKFMYGRYGIDELYHFLIRIYFILFFINIFLKNEIISSIILILFLITIFRIFSKNIKYRRKENMIYLNIKNNLINLFKPKPKQNYIYKKCHHCQKTLRLPIPYKRGIKKVICPSCHHKNKFIILKEEKIEIIKGGKKK